MNISSHYSLTATQCVIRAETRAMDRLRNNRNKHIYVYAFLALWRHKLEEKQLRYQKPMQICSIHIGIFCLFLFNLSKLLELLFKTLMFSRKVRYKLNTCQAKNILGPV